MNRVDFEKKFVKNKEVDLLTELKNETLPIILFGGGSMSYSIRKILKKNNITISGCWIDNGNEKELDDGTIVYSYEEIKRRYKEFAVVFGHSKYEMSDVIINRPEISRCYCLVNVCYGQWSRIEYDFVKQHIDEYYRTYELLEDDLSRECMIAYLNTRISEDFHHLMPVCGENTATYFVNPFFEMTENECLVDVGAYTGDTIEEFLKTCKKYKKIVAIEPEYESMAKIKAFIEGKKISNIELFEVGCWNENTTLSFGNDEESSGLDDNGKSLIEVKKMDDLLIGENISTIKINYLIGVCECIEGTKRIMKEQKPRMVITVGFDEWGIIDIPQLIKQINEDYKISLRFASAMPARLILFAY